ncbi:MAG TPA: hypothetical protein VEB23_10090 [Ramlibacter sp.]|nr:hypothetical protein [Ramlibacter sp.]
MRKLALAAVAAVAVIGAMSLANAQTQPAPGAIACVVVPDFPREQILQAAARQAPAPRRPADAWILNPPPDPRAWSRWRT